MRKNNAVFTALGTRTRRTVYLEFLTGEVGYPYEVHKAIILKSTYNDIWLDNQ